MFASFLPVAGLCVLRVREKEREVPPLPPFLRKRRGQRRIALRARLAENYLAKQMKNSHPFFCRLLSSFLTRTSTMASALATRAIVRKPVAKVSLLSPRTKDRYQNSGGRVARARRGREIQALVFESGCGMDSPRRTFHVDSPDKVQTFPPSRLFLPGAPPRPLPLCIRADYSSPLKEKKRRPTSGS